MGTENSYEELGSYAESLIKRKAAQVARLQGFTESDREDLEQEIAIRVWQRSSKYDPERGTYEALVSRLVDNAVAEIIALRRAPIRDPSRRECSLNEMIPDGKGALVERAETLDHETYLRRSGSLPEKELRDLRLHLAEAMESLPPKLRKICEMLEKETPAEVARRTGIPMSTVYDMKNRIREHFRRAGLEEYFPRNPRKNSKDCQ